MMIVRKLLNNEIDINVVKQLISNSIRLYEKEIKCDMTDPNNRTSLLAFISDDTYEFDCISRCAKSMIDCGVNINLWTNILEIVRKYNKQRNKNEKLYRCLKSIIKYYTESSNEYKFINKILRCFEKNGINVNSEMYDNINSKINLLENVLNSSPNDNYAKITLTNKELGICSNDNLNTFYNKSSHVYEIPIIQSTYEYCQKNIMQSETRQKINNILFEHRSDKISKLVYLIICKHMKAKLLNYENYFEYTSTYDMNTILDLLKNIVLNIRGRCDIETSVLSQLKKKFENKDELDFCDIDFYIHKWKREYGLHMFEISQYFELNETLRTIMAIIEIIFSIKFTKSETLNGYLHDKYDMETYVITKNGRIVGELTFDLFDRVNKLPQNRVICVNNNCMYPFVKKENTQCSMIFSMFLTKQNSTLLDIENLTSLFNNFGKVIYFISCHSDYNLFGCMYSKQEIVDMFGKFFELIMFEHEMLLRISKHYATGEKLNKAIISKIIQHRKLDFGIIYKYHCLIGLFDLSVHSQSVFVDECKKIMKSTDCEIQKNKITQHMYDVYNKLYSVVYNSGNINISKNDKHFHPILWSHLYNGNENAPYIRILSDIYGHMIYDLYSKVKNKNVFCTKLCDTISNTTMDNNIRIERITNTKITIEPMLNYYCINVSGENGMSLYQVANKTHDKEKLKLYVSPDEKILSDSEIEKRKMLSKVVYH